METSPGFAPPPASDPAPPPGTVVNDEAWQAHINDLADQRYAEFLSQHSVKTCTQPGCGVCRELSEIKADTIRTARTKLLEIVWRKTLEVTTTMHDHETPESIGRRMKAKLTKLEELDVSELW